MVRKVGRGRHRIKSGLEPSQNLRTNRTKWSKLLIVRWVEWVARFECQSKLMSEPTFPIPSEAAWSHKIYLKRNTEKSAAEHGAKSPSTFLTFVLPLGSGRSGTGDEPCPTLNFLLRKPKARRRVQFLIPVWPKCRVWSCPGETFVSKLMSIRHHMFREAQFKFGPCHHTQIKVWCNSTISNCMDRSWAQKCNEKLDDYKSLERVNCNKKCQKFKPFRVQCNNQVFTQAFVDIILSWKWRQVLFNSIKAMTTTPRVLSNIWMTD